MNVMNHRTRPSQVVTAGTVGGAIWRLMKSGRVPRRQPLAEVVRAVSDEVARRRLNKHPAFARSSDLVGHYPEEDLASIGGGTPV